MKLPTKWRTHHCAELRAGDVGKQVKVAGFAIKSADGESFELRDRHGKTMVVMGPAGAADLKKKAEGVKDEDVVAVSGIVAQRIDADPREPAGEIYVVPRTLDVLSEAERLPPPFDKGPKETDTEARLRFRWLDLRRPALQRRLVARSRALHEIRNYMAANDFIEVELPLLGRWTPDAVNAFVVPARPGRCYALPDSGQPFRQLLVASGLDRVFQVARRFRSESAARLGPLRQPEWTTVEIDAALVSEDDLLAVADGLVAHLYQALVGGKTDRKLEVPLRRIPYELSLQRYGTDLPDLRYGLDVVDLGKVAMGWPVPLFRDALGDGNGNLRAFRVPGAADRVAEPDLNKLATRFRGTGPADVTWLKLETLAKLSGPIAKFFDAPVARDMVKLTGAAGGDVVVFVSGKSAPAVAGVTGEARAWLARLTGQAAPDKHSVLWVSDVPFFRADPATGTMLANRHPFTLPREEDHAAMVQNKHAVRGQSFDLILNGIKVGSASMRCHDRAMQEKVFDLLEWPRDEVQRRFGFVLDAMRFGMPPHGGVTIGLDRLLAGLLGLPDVSEVMAFPKAVALAPGKPGVPIETALDPLTGAPTEIEPAYAKKLVGG